MLPENEGARASTQSRWFRVLVWLFSVLFGPMVAWMV